MSVIDTKYSKYTKNISNQRQFCTDNKFSTAELRHVAQHPTLSDGEKLLWLMVAQRAASMPNRICQLSDYKIGALIGESAFAISSIIKNMANDGFVKINNDNFAQPRYTLSLPDDSLLALTQKPYLNHPPFQLLKRDFLSNLRSKTKKWLNRFNLQRKSICQNKILKKYVQRKHQNSYIGNFNLSASKYNSQLGLLLGKATHFL